MQPVPIHAILPGACTRGADAKEVMVLGGRDVVIVGMGRVGRIVVEQMERDRSICVIDRREDRLGAVPDRMGRISVQKVHGDATSRLVLDQARLSARSVLIAVTGDDLVNREVARLAREHYGVEDIVTLVDDGEVIDEAGLSLADVVQRYRATAALVLNRVTAGQTRGVALGLGKGELLQVRVMPGSAAIGAPLREMHPHKWLVAAVYRDNKLLVPHGETVLAAGDRVLLVGEPEVLEGVGAFMRGGQPVFPTQYGAGIGVLGSGSSTRTEAAWLVENTLSDDLRTCEKSRLQPKEAVDDAVAAHLLDLGVGCLVVDPEPVSWGARIGFTRSNRKRLILSAHVPVLVARGTHPYKRILVAVGNDAHADVVAAAAIDLARQCEASLSVLTVLPPSLAEGADEQAEARALPQRVANLARLHNVEVEKIVDHGNPIERIRHHAQDASLLVLGCSAPRRNTIFTPDVSLFLLHDTPCSTLFVPWNPAAR
ncbi:MAG: NAD-binding protein [Myxococcota bacterium]|nr:NAD-binding protein [Myxococcota bacterium]